MLCTRCNASNSSTDRYCDACGGPLQPACPACGHSNRPGARFCGGCGHGLPRTAAANASTETGAAPVLPAALAALLSSRFAREGERKQVTVLFADIRGSTELIQELDPEQAIQRLEPGLRVMADAVHRYGGTVNHVRGDGIMALFGAPLALEDHAVRACLAAWAMLGDVARLSENRVDIRVGLNSGEVVVRSVGHDMSMQYEAVGPTTHLASRMEQLAAPGTACMSARTARLAAGFVEIRPRGPVDVKGVARPIEVFELTGAGVQNRWQARAARGLSRFIGRDTELQVLRDAWSRAKGGRGQVVAVAGEAGMGKSRLVHEFLNVSTLEGTACLRCAATPLGQEVPYQLVADILRSWLAVSGQDGPAEVSEKLERMESGLGSASVADLDPVRSLLDLPVRDANWATLDPMQRRQRTHGAVCSLLLRLAAAAPTILLVEDLHWADPESRSILDAAVDGLGPVRLMVVVTYRPEYQNDWIRHSHYSLVRLGPLDAGASDALLRALIGDAADLAPLRQRVVEQTDGTPLFLEEMAQNLVETGALVDEQARFRLTRDVAEVEIPASVQAVLAARIDRLPSTERTLLQIASVVGRHVLVMLLQTVADVPMARLVRQLLTLRSLEFLYDAGGAGAEYSFKHALTHAVAYDSMLVRHRRALHAQVLAAIEKAFPERLDEFTERLADHAVRGEIWDKAAHYCFKAGQRANALSAHRAAAAFFERALDAVGRLPPGHDAALHGIDIRLGLRTALVATGNLEQVRMHLQKAEVLARSIDDERRLMPVLVSRSTILNNLGALDEALETGLDGRALAKRLGDLDCFISSGFALGQAYWNRGDFWKAEEVLSGTIKAATGDPRRRHSGTTGTPLVLCLVSLSHTYALVGQPEQALAHGRKALGIAMDANRPYDLSYANAALGLSHLTVCEFDSAVRHLEEALRVARGYEITLLIPHAARYLGRAYAATGRLDEASALLTDTIEQARSRSLAALHGWCAAALGATRLLCSAPDEAEALVTEALDFARRQGYRPLQAHASRLLGAVQAYKCTDAASAARAGATFRAAARLARGLGMRPELAQCHQGLADLLVRNGREDEAQAEAATAAELYAACGMAGAAAGSWSPPQPRHACPRAASLRGDVHEQSRVTPDI